MSPIAAPTKVAQRPVLAAGQVGRRTGIPSGELQGPKNRS
jgi:hypothetical protein